MFIFIIFILFIYQYKIHQFLIFSNLMNFNFHLLIIYIHFINRIFIIQKFLNSLIFNLLFIFNIHFQ